MERSGLTCRITRWILRQLTFGYFRMTVEGLEHIPSEGGAVIAGNHPSVVDGVLLLVTSPRPIRFLVTEELFFHRLLHPLFRAFGCIPVYRTKTHNGDALRAAVEALEQGDVIGIFPEGTTRDRGVMREIRQGVGLLALRTGVPVIPLGIRGSFEAYPKGARCPTPSAIGMRFEPALRFARADDARIPEAPLARALGQIRETILGAMARTQVREHDGPWRAFRVAVSSLVVVPLTSMLTCTANPSLEPPERGGR